MSESLLPSVPPVSPFEAYTIIIVLPFLLRLIFVAPPLLDLSHKLLPKEDRTKHARWALDRIKRLNAERFWLIVLNELLAVLLDGPLEVGELAAGAGIKLLDSPASLLQEAPRLLDLLLHL